MPCKLPDDAKYAPTLQLRAVDAATGALADEYALRVGLRTIGVVDGARRRPQRPPRLQHLGIDPARLFGLCEQPLRQLLRTHVYCRAVDRRVLDEALAVHVARAPRAGRERADAREAAA